MLPPPRERRSPLILMIVLALIPAIALGYTWRWAQAKVPDTGKVSASAETGPPSTTDPGSSSTTDPSLSSTSSTSTSSTSLATSETTNLSTGSTTSTPTGAIAPTSTALLGTAGSVGTTGAAPDVLPVPVGALATPILSLRRTPEAIVKQTSDLALINQLSLLSGFVGDTSCLVVSIDGRVIFDHLGEIQVTPASSQKLLVAAVALETLTPEYTFTTRLLGTVVDGVVERDLFFVGGGDPLLSTFPYPITQEQPPTSTTSMETLVSNLAAAGVTRIRGNVIADESRYDTERFVPSWGADVKGIEAGPLSALMVDDAVRRVEPGSTTRHPDAAIGAATTLITMLKAAGISVGGSARAGAATPDQAEIASVESAPLSAIVAEMLTTSDDNTAELLLKEIAVASLTGNTRVAGLKVVAETLAEWGVDTTQLIMVDGSGLDSSNLVTCNAIRQVLTHAPLTGPLGTGLAVAGQTGTLATEVSLGAEMTGRMHAKTGTLKDTKALSGFVTTPVGNIEFALILDFVDASVAYPGIWGALADAFAAYPAGPTLEQVGPR